MFFGFGDTGGWMGLAGAINDQSSSSIIIISIIISIIIIIFAYPHRQDDRGVGLIALTD